MVKLRNVWPTPYNGIPAILSSLSLVLFVSAFLIIHYGKGAYDTLSFILFSTGIISILLSSGREVELKNGKLILRYGFPLTLISIIVEDIVDVADLSSLKRGKLIKYFKSQLVMPLLIMLLPVLYMPPITKPLMLLFLLVPVVVGFSLLTYFMMTFSDYKRFLNYTVITLAIILALIFLEAALVNSRIASSTDALLMLAVGYLLLIVGFIVFISFAMRRHIVLIESKRGYYAIAALSKSDAEALIKVLVKHLLAREG